MVFQLHEADDPKRLLESLGYERYRPDGFHWKKAREGMFQSIFHVVIDYHHPVLHIHTDTWKSPNNPRAPHNTTQNSFSIRKEMLRIKKKSLSGRLKAKQESLIDRLKNKLKEVKV